MGGRAVRVATKLVVGFGLLIAAMAALLVLHFSTLRGVVDANRDLSALASRLALSASEPARQLDVMEEMARKYQVTRDLRYAGRFEEAGASFDSTLRTLEAEPLEAGEREAIAELRVSWEDFRARASDLTRGLRPDPTGDSALFELDSLLAGLEVQTRRLSEASQAAMIERIGAAAAAARRTERISWAAIGAALLLSLVVSAFITRSISEPLGRLAAGTRAVAEGDFGHRLEPRHDDEFSRLARDFNRMTERLAELERAKQDFLSQVSHDLKSPLASMREAAALLLDEIPGPLTEKQRRLLQLSQRSGERLSSMISKLLDLSRMEAGTLEYQFRREDLADLARGAGEEFEARLPERELAMEARIPSTPLLFECDGDRIGQVVANLLENAIKFSPTGGTIRLAVRHLEAPPPDAPPVRRRRADGAVLGPGYALLEVADEGPGVPDEEREAIFEKFHQLEAGKRVARGGVGLGLAVCREIVSAHGGAIWTMRARGAGGDGDARGAGGDGHARGAVFRVLLPGARPAAEPARVDGGVGSAEVPARREQSLTS